MSVVIERFLICDNCGENFGVDYRNRTAKEQRSAAKYEGWRSSSGKDFCLECIENTDKSGRAIS